MREPWHRGQSPTGTDQTSAGCRDHDATFGGLSPACRLALWTVNAINAAMFVVEITAGALAGSPALLADALDFLGDTMRCGNSLAVIGMSVAMRASAALFKAGMLALPGPWGFGFTLWQVLSPDGPRAAVTGEVDVMALAASLASVGILPRSEDGAADVRSVGLCSRNDAIANIAGMIAAGAVAVTGTAWPDLAVAGRMAGLFLWSATSILRQAPSERATGKPTQAHHPPSTPPDAGKSAEQFPASCLSPVCRLSIAKTGVHF